MRRSSYHHCSFECVPVMYVLLCKCVLYSLNCRKLSFPLRTKKAWNRNRTTNSWTKLTTVKQFLWLNCGTICTQTQLYAQTDKLDHLGSQTVSLFSDKMLHYVLEHWWVQNSRGLFSNFMPHQWVFKSKLWTFKCAHKLTLPASHQNLCLPLINKQ